MTINLTGDLTAEKVSEVLSTVSEIYERSHTTSAGWGHVPGAAYSWKVEQDRLVDRGVGIRPEHAHLPSCPTCFVRHPVTCSCPIVVSAPDGVVSPTEADTLRAEVARLTRLLGQESVARERLRSKARAVLDGEHYPDDEEPDSFVPRGAMADLRAEVDKP